MFLEGTAYAQAAGNATGGNQQMLLTTVVPLVFLFAIFYFLLIRPQNKKATEHQKVLAGLKRNDDVVTTGGMLGRIVELNDKIVTLEVAANVRVRVERQQIAGLSSYGKTPKSPRDKEAGGSA